MTPLAGYKMHGGIVPFVSSQIISENARAKESFRHLASVMRSI
jgi:hypothetical protein